jgi:hypothetical protein
LRNATVKETWVGGRPVYKNAAANAADDKMNGEKR